MNTRSILIAITAFFCVSCENPDVSDIIISKSYDTCQNSSILVGHTMVSLHTPAKYRLHLKGPTHGYSIEVKQYFWELAECGDSIFVYGEKIKLKKKTHRR